MESEAQRNRNTNKVKSGIHSVLAQAHEVKEETYERLCENLKNSAMFHGTIDSLQLPDRETLTEFEAQKWLDALRLKGIRRCSPRRFKQDG